MAIIPSSPGFWLVLYNAPDRGKGRSFFMRQPIIAWDVALTPSTRVPITPTDETLQWPDADVFIETPDGKLVQGVIEFPGQEAIRKDREGIRRRRAA